MSLERSAGVSGLGKGCVSKIEDADKAPPRSS